MSTMPKTVEEVFEAIAWFRERFDLSHCGTYERHDGSVLIYGLQHPGDHLLVFDGKDCKFYYTYQDEWEEMTPFGPPFPWNEDGTGVVYPDPDAPKSWFETVINDFQERNAQ